MNYKEFLYFIATLVCMYHEIYCSIVVAWVDNG